jgi:hypothetical protein
MWHLQLKTNKKNYLLICKFLVMKCLFTFGGLGVEELGGKLVSMGYGGSSVFQGV